MGTMVDHCSSWQVGGDYGGPLFLMVGGWGLWGTIVPHGRWEGGLWGTIVPHGRWEGGLWGTTVPHGRWVGTMGDHCSSWQVGGGTMGDHCSSWQVGGDYGGPLFLMAGGGGGYGDHSLNCLLSIRSCDSLSCDEDLSGDGSEVGDDQIFEECSEQGWWMGTVSGCGH